MLKRLLHYHIGLTFVIMAISVFIAGLMTVNLFYLFSQNIVLIKTHGAMALEDGALLQFFELVVSGVIGLIAFIIFKASEQVIVSKILK